MFGYFGSVKCLLDSIYSCTYAIFVTVVENRLVKINLTFRVCCHFILGSNVLIVFEIDRSNGASFCVVMFFLNFYIVGEIALYVKIGSKMMLCYLCD